VRVIIAEKPSMGREIAAALGLGQRGEGFIEGPNEIVTWCVGHLVELDAPDAYDPRYKSWRFEHLPIIPERFNYHLAERTAGQFKVIRGLLSRKDVDRVVNACDAGREGELIFDLVYRQSGCRKPVERLWISSLTRQDIIEGFRNLKPAADYAGLRASAHARQQSDWLVGLNASRAQTLSARRAGHDGVFSLGRVQTPTLAIIVNRDREIADFVPTTYYQVIADFKVPAGNYHGTWFGRDGNRIAEKDAAERIAEKVKGRTGQVEKVEKKAARERPPLLYDLTALQRAANARYSFTAARTLELAQSLYEKKAITYPRTSSRHLSSGVAKEIERHLAAVNFGPYSQFVDEIVARGKPSLTKRHADDKQVTDHHAIIPTTQAVRPEAFDADEKRIYNLVARRFLAAFYPDAEIERTTIITGVEGERFMTRGSVVLKPGWRAVDPPGESARKTDDDEDDAGTLPPIKQNDPAETLNAEAVEKQTKAPPHYSESSLLGAMESAGKAIEDEELRLAMRDGGLGTPATRAAIIETLLEREYVRREKKTLVATPKGRQLIEMLPVALLKSPELTGQWESRLARMVRNEYAPEVFMQEVKTMVGEVVRQIGATEMSPGDAGDAPKEKRAVTRPDYALDCPKCAAENRAGFLIERRGEAGSFLVCSEGRPTCGFISDVPRNAKQRKAMAATKCPVCNGVMRFRLPREKGKAAMLSCVRYPDCRGARFFDEKSALEEPKPAPAVSEVKCQKCGQPMLRRQAKSSGKFFLSCSGWRSDGTGCDAPTVWLDESGRPQAARAEDYGPPCPGCGAPTVKRGPSSNGNYFWSCTKWRSDGTGCREKPIWINER